MIYPLTSKCLLFFVMVNLHDNTHEHVKTEMVAGYTCKCNVHVDS